MSKALTPQEKTIQKLKSNLIVLHADRKVSLQNHRIFVANLSAKVRAVQRHRLQQTKEIERLKEEVHLKSRHLDVLLKDVTVQGLQQKVEKLEKRLKAKENNAYSTIADASLQRGQKSADLMSALRESAQGMHSNAYDKVPKSKSNSFKYKGLHTKSQIPANVLYAADSVFYDRQRPSLQSAASEFICFINNDLRF